MSAGGENIRKRVDARDGEQQAGKRRRKERRRGKSFSVTKTISLPFDLFVRLSEEAEDRSWKFSAIVTWYINKGIAHEAIIEAERERREKEAVRRRLLEVAEEIQNGTQ